MSPFWYRTPGCKPRARGSIFRTAGKKNRRGASPPAAVLLDGESGRFYRKLTRAPMRKIRGLVISRT
jgi:hypothetical protein